MTKEEKRKIRKIPQDVVDAINAECVRDSGCYMAKVLREMGIRPACLRLSDFGGYYRKGEDGEMNVMYRHGMEVRRSVDMYYALLVHIRDNGSGEPLLLKQFFTMPYPTARGCILAMKDLFEEEGYEPLEPLREMGYDGDSFNAYCFGRHARIIGGRLYVCEETDDGKLLTVKNSVTEFVRVALKASKEEDSAMRIRVLNILEPIDGQDRTAITLALKNRLFEAGESYGNISEYVHYFEEHEVELMDCLREFGAGALLAANEPMRTVGERDFARTYYAEESAVEVYMSMGEPMRFSDGLLGEMGERYAHIPYIAEALKRVRTQRNELPIVVGREENGGMRLFFYEALRRTHQFMVRGCRVRIRGNVMNFESDDAMLGRYDFVCAEETEMERPLFLVWAYLSSCNVVNKRQRKYFRPLFRDFGIIELRVSESERRRKHGGLAHSLL